MPSWQHGSRKRDRQGGPWALPGLLGPEKTRENGAVETAEHWLDITDLGLGQGHHMAQGTPTTDHRPSPTTQHRVLSPSTEQLPARLPSPNLVDRWALLGFAQAQKDPAPRRFATPFTVTGPRRQLALFGCFFQLPSCPAAHHQSTHRSATRHNAMRIMYLFGGDRYAPLVPRQSILSCPPPKFRSRQSSHLHKRRDPPESFCLASSHATAHLEP